MRAHLEFAIDDREIGGVMERFRQIVETTVAEQLKKVWGEAAQAKEALRRHRCPHLHRKALICSQRNG